MNNLEQGFKELSAEQKSKRLFALLRTNDLCAHLKRAKEAKEREDVELSKQEYYQYILSLVEKWYEESADIVSPEIKCVTFDGIEIPKDQESDYEEEEVVHVEELEEWFVNNSGYLNHFKVDPLEMDEVEWFAQYTAQ